MYTFFILKLIKNVLANPLSCWIILSKELLFCNKFANWNTTTWHCNL